MEAQYAPNSIITSMASVHNLLKNYKETLALICSFLACAVLFRVPVFNTQTLVTKSSLRESVSGGYKADGHFFVNRSTIFNETAPVHFRFPSVQERISYYMGGWINASGIKESDLVHDYCNKDLFTIGDHPGPVILDLELVSKCVDAENGLSRLRTTYCRGVLPMLVDPTMHTMRPRYYQLMVLAQFGDSTKNLHLPVVVKAREITGKIWPKNILWPLNVRRHYRALFDESDQLQSVPWEKKKDALIWRGAPTGDRSRIVEKLFHRDTQHIDVAFTRPKKKGNVTEAFIRPKLEIKDMVKYRYLLSLEGNDVATGLKWMLWSNSVVLMAKPTTASWAMEDMLQPFVHYIPVKDDYSDVHEMLEWARQHQEECSQISYQAALYMYNLVMSDQAQKDNELILSNIRTLYQQQFGIALYKYCQK